MTRSRNVLRPRLLALLAALALPACSGSSPDSAADTAAAERAEWYVSTDGDRRGPLTESALRAEITSGTVRASDPVWREGMGDWAPAASVLDSVLGTGPADATGSAFLDLCTRVASISREDMEVIDTFTASDGGPRLSTSQVRGVLASQRDVLADARDGLRAVGGINHDYSKGDMLLLPHLSPARRLARLLAADAALASADGDATTAAADCAAAARLARQVAADRTLISSLVSMAIGQLFIDIAGDLPAGADGDADMRDAADWLGGSDPFGIVAGIETERTYGVDYVVGEIRAGRMDEYARIASLGREAQAALLRASGDLDGSAAGARAAYDELVGLLADGARPSAEVSAFFDRVESGAHGDLAIVVLASVERIIESAGRAAGMGRPVVRRFGG